MRDIEFVIAEDRRMRAIFRQHRRAAQKSFTSSVDRAIRIAEPINRLAFWSDAADVGLLNAIIPSPT
jgi:hypothetical protein